MIPFIDAHHHIWDIGLNDYPWLTHSPVKPIYGDYSDLKRNYLLRDFLDDAKALPLLASVHVEAGFNPENCLDETAWLEEVTRVTPDNNVAAAIVGFADFRSDDVAQSLAGHAKYSRVRGIRQMLNARMNPSLPVPNDLLADPDWCRRLGLLAEYDFSFDIQIYPQQMKLATALVDQHPSVQFIIDHSGMPVLRDMVSLDLWRDGMSRLAERANVVLKLSGWGMMDRNWTEESIRPLILDAISIFGPDRCMFASNFPVDKLMTSYSRLWTTYDRITADFSQDQRADLFRNSAVRTYRIDLTDVAKSSRSTSSTPVKSTEKGMNQ